MGDDRETWALEMRIGDQAGIDVGQVVKLIRDHYISVNGKHVEVIRGDWDNGYPSNYWRIRDRKDDA